MFSKTTDYTKFKTFEYNRELRENRVQSLMESLQTKNMLDVQPILVDEEMRIIDGQHRLEAAKRLKLPVYYMITTKHAARDILLLNRRSDWDSFDYIHYWDQMGNVEYRKLILFMKEAKLTSLSLISALQNLSEGGNFSRLIKDGRYKFPTDAELLAMKEMLRMATEVIELVEKSYTTDSAFIFTSRFLYSLFTFLKTPKLDFKIFKEKLLLKLNHLKPCSKRDDYIDIMRSIYNFNMRKNAI